MLNYSVTRVRRRGFFYRSFIPWRDESIGGFKCKGKANLGERKIMTIENGKFFARVVKKNKGDRHHYLSVLDKTQGEITLDEKCREPIKQMAFDPTGRFLVTLGQNYLTGYDLQDVKNATKPLIMKLEHEVNSFKFSEDVGDNTAFFLTCDLNVGLGGTMTVPVLKTAVPLLVGG